MTHHDHDAAAALALALALASRPAMVRPAPAPPPPPVWSTPLIPAWHGPPAVPVIPSYAPACVGRA